MISAALFALSALALFVFALQTRPVPYSYRSSVQLRLSQIDGVGGLPGEQGTADMSDEAELSTNSLIARWQPYIAEASQRFAVPEAWIEAVMRAESGGRTMLAGQPITSKAGAMGLMQLMKDTYREMRDRYSLGADVHDPRDNILAGAAYLGLLRERYGYPNLFAAYNAGPTRVDEHLQRRKPLPRETRNYLGIVTQMIAFTTGGASKRQQGKTIQLSKNG